MPSIPAKFYVMRGYVVKASNVLGDRVVMNSFEADTEEGKSKAEKLRGALQQFNDTEQNERTTKTRKRKI